MKTINYSNSRGQNDQEENKLDVKDVKASYRTVDFKGCPLTMCTQ